MPQRAPDPDREPDRTGDQHQPPPIPASALTLVVPLYNETHRFAEHAPELAGFITGQPPGSELVFVDDGSDDGTVALVERFIDDRPGQPLRLLRRPHAGKGAAVSAGLASAMTDMAGFCDLDLATPLSEFERIADAARRAPILAVGSRGVASSRLTRRQHWVRELLGRAYNRAVQLTITPGIVDTQCGAKAASTTVWHKILPCCREQGFAWDVEAIAVARTLGVTVQEIGIEWRHQDGSRVKTLSAGSQMLRAIPRIRRNLVSTLRRRSRAESHGGGAFGDANAAALSEADSDHWWFRSKATFVSLLIRRQAPTDGWLVDIGGGSGGVSALLGWAPDRTVVVEGNPQLVQEARRRHALVPVAADAALVPLAEGSADLVTLLDVIEHLSDPVPALREAARLLSDRGRLVVNVPGHPALWSSADEVLGHARRYTRRSLRRDLEKGGLEVLWISHVFSWLAVPVWLKRRAFPGSEPQLGLDVGSPLLDRLSMLLTRVEWELVSRASSPVGTSVLCIARRTDAGAGRAR